MQLNVLGPFEAKAGAGGALKFSTNKTRALLAYLALNSDRPHSREKLACLLWGEAADARARANLRQTLMRVRQTLPAPLADCIAGDNGAIRLDGGALQVDTEAFRQAIAEGTIEGLERAAALYRGELLDDMLVDEAEFETWLRRERQRFREQAIGCFEALLDHYKAIGASTRGIEICRRLLQLDPYRESIHRLLMAFYADQDRRGAAIAQYEECRALLDGDLGVEPEDETQSLHRAIRDRSTAGGLLATPDRPGATADGEQGRVRSSRAVTDLVSRSPWRGASWTKPSIAVLPFDWLDGDASNAYLCDGVVEDIITNLARFQDLHVIARNSSFAYRGKTLDVGKIGAELGVRYLVEGSLLRIGDSVRVTAQLIEAETGYHIWAERCEQTLAGLSTLRDEITGRIASVLVGRVEQHRLDSIKTREPENWEAYECWLRGMDYLRRVTWEKFHAATEQFERALEIDPTYARAYAGLAMAQYEAFCLNWTSWWKLHKNALGYARKALELDDQDHHVHCILGIVSLYTRDYGPAHYHLNKAEQINPNNARTLANAAIAWALMGEKERGVRMAELAIRLDPFHPDWYLTALGIAYYATRDYERAIASMEIAPDGLCDTRAYLAAAYGQLGDAAAAERHAKQFIQTSSERLGGDPATDVPYFVDAVIESSPYAADDDTAHFAEGLQRAGLPIDSDN